ncbi:MAG: carbohydrate ABC transporter permease [Firmicutes bacterium]|nr:carbohydrate ABC transporter permease [Bacillota bacterium]
MATSTAAVERVEAVKRTVTPRRKPSVSQAIIHVVLIMFVIFAFVPLVLTVFMSFRSYGQVLIDFWALPHPWLWQNYVTAWNGVGINILDSLGYCLASTIFTMALAGISGYVFGRHKFPGREVLFLVVLALIMIPGILTLIPTYVLVTYMHIVNTPWALILPWTSGGQVLGIFLVRSYIAGIPEEIFESARLEGASEWAVFRYIGMPMSWPMLMTVGVLQMIGTYNDYIWPSLVINNTNMQPVALALWKYTSTYTISQMGPEFAAYVIAAIPLIALMAFGMRYFIQGATSGAIKL